MILRDLIAALPGAAVRGPVEGTVGSLALDSRRVAAGDVFFALAGVHADGARFVADAVRAGALAVVTARGAEVPDGVTHVEVDEPRLALAQAACARHGDPSRAMRVVAVTGTNGKTTTTYLLESIYAAAGWSAGVIGTTGIRIAGESRPSAFTTPESPQLQALLAEMRDRGVEAVAMEASSHALVQRRTWGLACGAAIFTNLTQDHLDYHGTMAAYLDAKLMLFDGRNGGAQDFAGAAHSIGAGGAELPPIPTAVVNADDGACERVCDAARAGGMRVLRYGDARVADVRLVSVRAVSAGLELCVAFAGTERAFVLPMLGRFNAHNAAGAIGAALALGVEPAAIVRGLSAFAGVPGRLERVSTDEPFAVAVDYAHTPDALERALAACREHATGRVLCVFGCGGDRDRGKRPQMGAIAARLADRAWVTNDNPRSERPEDIAAEIVAGAPAGALEVTLDRRAAIAAAIRAAGPGDLVLIAGKGHESTQTIGSDVLPFDDRAVAREVLGALR